VSGFTRTAEWDSFLKHAAYVLRNPLFEPEERDTKLEIARRGQKLLDSVRRAEPIADRLGALFQLLSNQDRQYELVPRTVEQWANSWAFSDEASFRRALECFLDPEKTAEERFAAFVKVAQEARAAGFASEAERVLTFGSLLNFVVSPQSSPILGLNAFIEQLGSLVGYEPRDAPTLAGRYRSHLDFARQLAGEMKTAGVGVRDMLDVQSLVLLSSRWFSPGSRDELWMSDPPNVSTPQSTRLGGPVPPGNSSVRQGVPYLAICSCLGYDAPYLLEWIEFHRLVGVERFFLYNNGDREAQRELLAPYVEEGTVVLHDWPIFPPELPAREHCIDEHREDSRWIAFIDTDEFLFSPTGQPLPGVLVEYEQWPGVGVSRVTFGTSGHRTKPDGLVIESYVQPLGLKGHRTVQWIVAPRRTVEICGSHRFGYEDGTLGVDENHYPILGIRTTFKSFSRLRINHYYTRSEEEFREKLSRPRAWDAEPQPDHFWELFTQKLPALFDYSDDAILRYLPSLKKAMENSHGRARGSEKALLRSRRYAGSPGRPAR
jgi:hypothetical protein